MCDDATRWRRGRGKARAESILERRYSRRGDTGGVNNSVQVGFAKARNGVRYAVLWPFLSKPMHVQHGRMFVDAFRVR